MQVRVAFADSLRSVWYVMLGVSVLGLASTLLMREVTMKNTLDTTWGLQDEKKQTDSEIMAGVPEADCESKLPKLCLVDSETSSAH